jgi:hypothetical protein
MDILLKLDLEGTHHFFDAFFDLESHFAIGGPYQLQFGCCPCCNWRY